MIWNQDEHERNTVPLAEYLLSLIMEASPSADSTRHDLREAALGVAHYLAGERKTESISSEFLLFLVYRALCSLGRQAEAEQIVERQGSDMGIPAQALSLLTGGHVTQRTFSILSSRLAWPSEWTVIGGDTVWVLNLDRMTIGESDQIELALFQAVQTILSDMAAVWDAWAGKGVLGLRHVRSAASTLLGADSDRKKTDGLVRELVSFCEDQLDHLRSARGWDHRPFVMVLDV